MDGKTLARLGAVVFVAVAITATAIEMSRKEEAPEAWPSGRTTQTPTDPLRDELIRCPAPREAGPPDTASPPAWAAIRNRSLTPGLRPAQQLPALTHAPGIHALLPLERTRGRALARERSVPMA